MSLRVATTQWRIDRALLVQHPNAQPSSTRTTTKPSRAKTEPPNLCTPRLQNLRLAGIGNSLFSPQAKPERPEQEIADALVSAFELRAGSDFGGS